ncbi:hypothetical protein [Staphylococcus phage tp310-3]|uniref:hypothetical protein n=1 Tax=Staphylococcus phage tp310-3 TaxID=445517 RepID=UPI00015A3735|nr:hypothetical protein SPTP3103_p02 [Staphylococcus phage tp310-3]ABS87531.1 hypothetical protein [Staphylococcus phage tp310-3]
MTQFLGALLLTGVLGYIPYKYLTMIGLVSEKNKIINTPVLLIFSIETCLIWFYTFIIFNNVDLKNLSLPSVAYRSKSKYLVSNYFCFNSACI